jgi:hypothetical protein
MRIISFGWTAEAVRREIKTVTRREWGDDYAAAFKVGMLCQAHDKDARYGGKRIKYIKIMQPLYKEHISEMPDSDYRAEGFEFYAQNPHLFVKTNPYGCTWEDFLAWRKLDKFYWVCRYGYPG